MTTPGFALFLATPDDLNASCSAEPDASNSVSCTGIQPAGPPLSHNVSFTTVDGASPVKASHEAGWNLVGGPAGYSPSGAIGPLYTFPAGASMYSQVQPDTALSPGVGYWAYMPSPTTDSLSVQFVGPVHVNAAGGTFLMVGNPYAIAATVSVPGAVTGGVVAYQYTPATGYQVIATRYDAANRRTTLLLSPGQGAWLFCADDATVYFYPSVP